VSVGNPRVSVLETRGTAARSGGAQKRPHHGTQKDTLTKAGNRCKTTTTAHTRSLSEHSQTTALSPILCDHRYKRPDRFRVMTLHHQCLGTLIKEHFPLTLTDFGSTATTLFSFFSFFSFYLADAGHLCVCYPLPFPPPRMDDPLSFSPSL